MIGNIRYQVYKNVLLYFVLLSTINITIFCIVYYIFTICDVKYCKIIDFKIILIMNKSNYIYFIYLIIHYIWIFNISIDIDKELITALQLLLYIISDKLE
jgi:hypothetical protein